MLVFGCIQDFSSSQFMFRLLNPPSRIYSRCKKLALQYCLKLSANTNNPAYNAVFLSKFETQFDNKPS